MPETRLQEKEEKEVYQPSDRLGDVVAYLE